MNAKYSIHTILYLLLTFFLLFTNCDCDDSTSPKVELISTVASLPASQSVVVNEIFDTYIKVKNINDLMTFGAKVYFDKNKLEVAELTRMDTFLTSNGGSVNQLSFRAHNDEGYVSIALGVTADHAVSDTSDEWQTICKITYKALSPGTADIELNIDHDADGDVGLFDDTATLIEDITVEDATVEISN